jgi:hypothetical protein
MSQPQFIIVLISIGVIVWLVWRSSSGTKGGGPPDGDDR